MNGEITLTRLEKLGKGGYGSVYKCMDSNGKYYALKTIEIEKEGLPCLIEASIMTSIIHPHLNNAMRVYTTSSTLNILQPLAKSDLYSWAKQSTISSDLLNRWTYAICQAVKCLHNHSIIHGDIKASNILLFENNVVKLSDFGLSVKANKDVRIHICTCTHRPLEVWLGRSRDLSLDIWSLGCMLYELVTGYSLFPDQSDNRELSDKSKIHDKYVNCILEWGIMNGQKTDIEKRSCKYFPPRLSTKFDQSPIMFKELVLSMLQIDPEKRPSINKILESPYFLGLPNIRYDIIHHPKYNIHQDDILWISRNLKPLSRSEDVLDLAQSIYARTYKFVQDDTSCKDKGKTVCSCCNNSYVHLVTCAWIAGKTIRRIPTDPGTLFSSIIELETKICNYLQYHIYDFKLS